MLNKKYSHSFVFLTMAWNFLDSIWMNKNLTRRTLSAELSIAEPTTNFRSGNWWQVLWWLAQYRIFAVSKDNIFPRVLELWNIFCKNSTPFLSLTPRVISEKGYFFCTLACFMKIVYCNFLKIEILWIEIARFLFLRQSHSTIPAVQVTL